MYPESLKDPYKVELVLSELVERVWPKLESGEIKPTVYKILPMSEAEEAHGILERGENIGKVVLTLK